MGERREGVIRCATCEEAARLAGSPDARRYTIESFREEHDPDRGCEPEIDFSGGRDEDARGER